MPTKIFVGNVPVGVTNDVIRSLFEGYGTVTECDILGTYGFVHMEDEEQAKAAIDGLNLYNIHGTPIKVELSTVATQGKKKALRQTTKIFIGNIRIGTTSAQLREIFEPYGEVTEADVVGGFGFVHMANEREALEAIKDLNGFKLNNNAINVELSTRDTQGKAKGQDGFPVLERGRGGMMPWGPTRGRGRGIPSSRFDPYSAPMSGNSWMPRQDPYAGMHGVEQYPTEQYRNPGLHAPLRPPMGAGGDDMSFARELLQLYSQDPAAFDAYARNPQVLQSLNVQQSQSMMGRPREDPYLKPPRDYMQEPRMPQPRMMQPAQPGMMMSAAYGRTMQQVQPTQQAMQRPMPPAGMPLRPPAQLYMSFE